MPPQPVYRKLRACGAFTVESFIRRKDDLELFFGGGKPRLHGRKYSDLSTISAKFPRMEKTAKQQEARMTKRVQDFWRLEALYHRRRGNAWVIPALSWAGDYVVRERELKASVGELQALCRLGV